MVEQLEGRPVIGKKPKEESALLANEFPKLKNEKKSEKNVSFKLWIKNLIFCKFDNNYCYQKRIK